MFRCDLCRAMSKPGQKCHKILAAAEKKIYPRRMKANVGYKENEDDRIRSKSRSDRIDDEGGEGWEIKREVNVIGCQECTGNGQPCPGKFQG